MDYNITEIINKAHRKYDLARYQDFNFDPDNYIWLMGNHIFTSLYVSCCDTLLNVREEDDHFVRIFMGISIEIDHKNPEGLRLFKEIK